MKKFDIKEYTRPMLSKPGMISSSNCMFHLKSIAKFYSKDFNVQFTVPLKSTKILSVPKPKKKKKVPESSSFKSVGRFYGKVSDSPSPDRYHPHYDFLYKKSPQVVFVKRKNKYSIGEDELRSKSSELVIPAPEVPYKIRGISFEKQLNRKKILSGLDPHEKRFDTQPKSSFIDLKKIHSFSSYTNRKSFFNTSKYQPEYSPKYSFVSKHFKNNYLVD
jgi:hypothetical protein